MNHTVAVQWGFATRVSSLKYTFSMRTHLFPFDATFFDFLVQAIRNEQVTMKGGRQREV